MSERDPEQPVADAEEQRRALVENGDEPPADLPLDVDEADAAEQRREVKLDEDDYR